MDRKDKQPRTKLPVWGTLGAAYATVFFRPGDLFALAIIPLAISVVGEIFTLFDPTGAIAGFSEDFGPGAAEGLTVLVGFLTTYLPWGGFVVAWHRLVLLEERGSRWPVESYFGSRAPSVFKNDLFLVILIVGVLFVSAAISLSVLDFPPGFREGRPPFNFLILAMAVVVASRLSFQDPALAIGCRSDIPTAWRQSRGVGWRQFWILLLAPFPFILLENLVGSPGPATAGGPGSPVQEVATLEILAAVIAERLVLFLGTAVIVAALCISYRRVVDERDRGRLKPTSASDWMTGFVFPILLGLVLGAATASVAAYLRLSTDEQFILAVVAFLIPLSVKIYQFASDPSEEQVEVGRRKEPPAQP